MRRRRRAGEEKKENRQPILKNKCAALLRTFRGQHSKKMEGSARGNCDPRQGQQSFGPNPNGVGDRTTTLRRLLIGPSKVLSTFPIRIQSSWQLSIFGLPPFRVPTRNTVTPSSDMFISTVQFGPLC